MTLRYIITFIIYYNILLLPIFIDFFFSEKIDRKVMYSEIQGMKMNQSENDYYI